MRLTLSFALLVTLTALPTLAEAAPRRYYRRDAHRHAERHDPYREGLFARVSLGAAGVTADDDLNDSTLSGGAGLFSLDLGGSIAPSLALHGRLSVNSMFEPSISSDGRDFGDLEDTSLTFTLLGAGLTLYLPSNVYLSGALGFSRASFELDGYEYERLYGGGFTGDLGYDWMLDDEWGVGIAGRLELHSVRGEGEQLSTAGLGVLISLTHF